MHVMPQVLRALLPMALGLVFRLSGVMGERDGDTLRRFVVRFTLPLFVFFSLSAARPESLAALLPTAAAFVLITLLLFGAGWVASAAVEEPERRAALHACVSFGNYGWMGLGVMSALLGEPGEQRVIYFFLLWWPVFYAVGLPIGFIHVREAGGVPLRRTVAVAAPPIAAMVLGLAANAASVPLPPLAAGVLKPFGDMTVPLILFSVGLVLDPGRVRGAVGPALLVSGITLLLAPFAGWALAALLARDPLTRSVIILECAMPVATLTPLLEENFPMDKELVSTAIVLSTLLSLVTLPVAAAVVL
jgi:predicted permease